MVIKRVCKSCGNEFEAIKMNQFFCSRNCFKKDYYLKNRVKIEKSIRKPHFPKKKCGFCGNEEQLDFDPIKNPNRFSEFECANCGATNKMLWKYEDCEDYREEILKLLAIKRKSKKKKVVIEDRKIYHIPRYRPEECSSNILVLSCEVITSMDVKKLSRKKMTFY
jgi:hypothetical protein